MAGTGYDISASVSTSSNAASRAGEGTMNLVSLGGLKGPLNALAVVLALFLAWKLFKK